MGHMCQVWEDAGSPQNLDISCMDSCPDTGRPPACEVIPGYLADCGSSCNSNTATFFYALGEDRHGHACLMPTASPTTDPTSAPTQHFCDSGEHLCDAVNSKCVEHDSGWHDVYECECDAGYECIAGCTSPYVDHECEVTRSPTENPTPTPTAAPTAPPKEEEEAFPVGVIAGVGIACIVIGAGIGRLVAPKPKTGGGMGSVMPQPALNDGV